MLKSLCLASYQEDMVEQLQGSLPLLILESSRKELFFTVGRMSFCIVHTLPREERRK